MFKVYDIEKKECFAGGFIRDLETPDGPVASSCLINTLGQADLLQWNGTGWSSRPKFKHVILQNTFHPDSNGHNIYGQYGEGAVDGDVVTMFDNLIAVACWDVFQCQWILAPLNMYSRKSLWHIAPTELTIIGNTCELGGLPTKVQPMVEKYLEASREQS